MPAESSPEQFIVELAEKSELLQFMGELTGLMKGIKGKGYMARFAEIYNDMHKCPKIYVRKLRKRKGEDNIFKIENGYFSVLSTVTPEMLKQECTEEMAKGGWLARWMLVYGEPNPRPRKRLREEILEMEEILMWLLRHIISMDKSGTQFYLSDKALDRYNEIEKLAIAKYDKCLAFVGRYMNYMISYADVLLLDDAIGMATKKLKPLNEYKHLTDLIHLKCLI